MFLEKNSWTNNHTQQLIFRNFIIKFLKGYNEDIDKTNCC